MALEVEIEKLVYGGRGLARLEGRVVLAPFVIPGEKLTVQPVKEAPKLIEARPLEWQRRSEQRVNPECPLFQSCGGCHYQHIAYPQQLEYKSQILRETLARIAKIAWDGPIETVAGEPWGYRNRTQLHIRKGRAGSEVGFLEAGSGGFVAAEGCPINSPGLNRCHRALTAMAREKRFPGFLREIEFFTNEREVQINVLESDRRLAKPFFDWCAETIEGVHPGEYLDYPIGPDVFRVGSRCFFQVNRFLTDELARLAVGDAGGRAALDLYAGVGLLTLPLARRFDRVTAVDASRRAAHDLQFNAERAGLEVRIANLNVDEFLAGFDEPIDFVLADPPRAGLGVSVTAELLRLKAPALVLVSCDPATLARDLQTLTGGGYRIDGMTLIDLFPQTFHLETVVRLRFAGEASG